MTSGKSNETNRQLSFIEEEDRSASPNIQRDDSTAADIEKSALNDDTNALMEAIADNCSMGLSGLRRHDA